jgi:hypothetical protein
MSLLPDLALIHRLHAWNVRHSEWATVLGLLTAIGQAIGQQASPAGWLRRLSRQSAEVFVPAFAIGALILGAAMLIGITAGFFWKMPENGLVFGIYLGSLANVLLGLFRERIPNKHPSAQS